MRPSGLVTGVAKRPEEARLVKEAEVALRDGRAPATGPVLTLANGGPAPASIGVIAGPASRVTAAAGEGPSSSRARARPAAWSGARPPALANVPAQARGLPKVAMAVLREGARAAAVGAGVPTLIRRGPARRLGGPKGHAPMADPLRNAPTEATALPPAPGAAPVASPTAAARAPRPATGGAVDVLQVQARKVGAVDVISRAPTKATPGGPPPLRITAAASMASTA